jgi:Zinc carboxypeptidase/RTX calcium-binding nonapeptide repeat (4 copies)
MTPRRALALAAGFALLAPATAAASQAPRDAFTTEVHTAEAVARTCAARALGPGADGVARVTWAAPAGGLAEVRLRGAARRGDWDLAVFEPGGGEAAGASTSFGSAEQVGLWVERGDRLEIQACRRDGADAAVPLTVALTPIQQPARPAQPSERISLETVALTGPGDLVRLGELGVEITDHVEDGAATVTLYSDAERGRLAAAGFDTSTLVADVAAADRADRAAELAAASAPGRSVLPTGRETYRVMEDYTSEMKQLAEQRPDLVRPVVVGTTVEGRPIEGIEIAAGVDSSDGRPAYLQIGLVHAREWPSGEMPMEFAHDLVAGYGSDPRITALLDRVRVFVVPVLNVDGFIASRSFGASPVDDDPAATQAQAVNDEAAYKRKNCRPTVPGSESVPCPLRSRSGVDLNRNFGAYWGGVGSSGDAASTAYRGPAPFSEPEAEALHAFSSRLQPTVVIVNHTFTETGEWLRQPGFDDVVAVTPDEAATKQLGDAMAAASGWGSHRALAIGEITGAAEDWNYFAQGSYGYTSEIRGTNFHGNYAASVVTEYVGDAAHFGLGVREAYLLAGERAAVAADHSVISGSAPAAATLRLRKTFTTPTSQGTSIPEQLESTLEVGQAGAYEWHVNPSSRPDVREGAKREPKAEAWTMTCELAGVTAGRVAVAVDRGRRVSVRFGADCTPRATCGGATATIVGSGEVRGSSARDVILGSPQSDRIDAGGGRDVVCAGGGRDRIDGGGGRDRCRGGPGRDRLRSC